MKRWDGIRLFGVSGGRHYTINSPKLDSGSFHNKVNVFLPVRIPEAPVGRQQATRRYGNFVMPKRRCPDLSGLLVAGLQILARHWHLTHKTGREVYIRALYN